MVKGAFALAEGEGVRTVGAEHLLLALLDREGSRASLRAGRPGLAERREAVRGALRETRRRAGLTRAETDALAGLGIDVAEVVARVEEVHGLGAMSEDVGDLKDLTARGGRRRGRQPVFGREARGCWRGRCGLRSGGGSGISGTSICCWR